MKWLILVTFSISGMLVWQPSFAQEALTTQYSQSELLKNWALSHCLALVYKDDVVKNDARATASAYLEYGNNLWRFIMKLMRLRKIFRVEI